MVGGASDVVEGPDDAGAAGVEVILQAAGRGSVVVVATVLRHLYKQNNNVNIICYYYKDNSSKLSNKYLFKTTILIFHLSIWLSHFP